MQYLRDKLIALCETVGRVAFDVADKLIGDDGCPPTSNTREELAKQALANELTRHMPRRFLVGLPPCVLPPLPGTPNLTDARAGETRVTIQRPCAGGRLAGTAAWCADGRTCPLVVVDVQAGATVVAEGIPLVDIETIALPPLYVGTMLVLRFRCYAEGGDVLVSSLLTAYEMPAIYS